MFEIQSATFLLLKKMPFFTSCFVLNIDFFHSLYSPVVVSFLMAQFINFV